MLDTGVLPKSVSLLLLTSLYIRNRCKVMLAGLVEHRKLCAYAGTILPTLVSHRRVVVATCDAWVLPGVPQ